MPVEKNLFPYDLAVVAIFKDEAPYLREWLDYHLAAGVEHFYMYNNDSSDNFAEILAPYIAAKNRRQSLLRQEPQRVCRQSQAWQCLSCRQP